MNEFKHKAEEAKGKAEEGVGEVTRDDALKNQGKREQSKADVKQAGDKVKDAFDKK